MRAQNVEDGAEVLHMCCPRATVDQYVIEEDKDAAAQEGLEDGVH